MKIGISVASTYQVDDAREGARNMIERARAARDADLDSLFVGDHHVTVQPYYQNTAILGRMLAEWGDRTAGALYLLPLWNPVLLAEQVATLAAIHAGPFVMQCGLGGGRRQVQGMGVALSERAHRFEIALDALRALWAGERVDIPEFWGIRDATISPLPPEPVDVWIGASVPRALRRAARMGDAWLASPGLTPDQAADDLNRYRQACAEFDRHPTSVAIRRDVYVGDDARSVVAPYVDAGYRGIAPEALMFGSVEEVAEQMRLLGDAGYTDIIVRNLTSDQGQALKTIERLGLVRELV